MKYKSTLFIIKLIKIVINCEGLFCDLLWADPVNSHFKEIKIK